MTRDKKHEAKLRWRAKVRDCLDWYYQHYDDPELRTTASACGACECGAHIGDPHKVGCKHHGKLFLGFAKASASSSPANLRQAERAVAIGNALRKLSKSERQQIEECWTFREQYWWWKNRDLADTKYPTPIPHRRFPEFGCSFASKRQVSVMKMYFRALWLKARRRVGVQTSIEKLEELARSGAIW